MIRDPKRVYDGQASVRQGVDSSGDPSLIGQGQVSWAVNVTFRESFPTNRPPFEGQWLAFDSADTKTRFHSGKFQGACYYEDYLGGGKSSAIIVARGGRLFRISFDATSGVGLLVDEITVRFQLVLNYEATVPGMGGSVDLYLSDITTLAVGDVLVLDSGTYTVTALFENAVVVIGGVNVTVDIARATYGGGAANATIATGTPVLVGGNPVTVWDTNTDDDFAFLFQAENYVIVFQGQFDPIIFDGSGSRRSGGIAKSEIPPGFCGAYINGRIWMALPDRRQYIASDLVGSSSGSLATNRVDAILKFTSNTIINEGGAFRVPDNSGLITAIIATVTIDTSLGQGPVSIFTTNSIFTNVAPADATVWKDLTFPIQTVAQVGDGAAGPRFVVNKNSDAWYRGKDGIWSFVVARRDFNAGWANSPMSNEMLFLLDQDTEDLLMYGSVVAFDNRVLFTSVGRLTEWGVIHSALGVLNFDEISTMFNRTTPAWEGMWTGPGILQILTGRSASSIQKCWVLSLNESGQMQVYELLTYGRADRTYQVVNDEMVLTETPIQSWLITRSMMFGSLVELKKLDYGETWVDRVDGSVDLEWMFHPNQYPCWVPWHTKTICNTMDVCNEECGVATTYQPGYRPQIRLPAAPEACLTGMDERANRGYEFQVRLQWTGKCRIKALRLQATVELDSVRGTC